MLKFTAFVAVTALLASPAQADNAAKILAANRAATGGNSWHDKSAVSLTYAFSGTGLTGKITSLDDLEDGRWSDDAVIGPITQKNGYDGAHAWIRDQSGTVTVQDGGDEKQIAINEAYRRANMWWRPGFGGALVVSDGQKTQDSASYDVLTVTPKNGKSFDAWFDAKTHLLFRTVEDQAGQHMTTTLSDYRASAGVSFAYKINVNNGNAKYDQNMTLTAVVFLPAQADAAFAMPKVAVADFAIAGAAAETSVPFDLINNHIYAPVTVNGKPFRFAFDTGGVNMIAPPTAQLLGLTAEGHLQGSGAGDGHMDLQFTKVKSLGIGDATVNDQVFPVAPFDKLSPVEGIDLQGMVGFETFRRFVTRVDYGSRTLTLIDPKHFDPRDAGTPLPFTFYGNSIVAQASLDGHTGNFMLDTGSRTSLTLNGAWVTKNGITGSSDRSVTGVTGWDIGGPTHSIVMRGKTFAIGPYTVDGLATEIATDHGGSFSDPTLAGNIGAGLLRRYIVTLDYGHSTIYLKPLPGHIDDLDTFDRAGLWINRSADGFTVVDVMKGTPAESAGLKAGDTIVAVDGEAATSIPLHQMRKRLRNEAPGTVVTFTTKSGATVKMTLRDLI